MEMFVGVGASRVRDLFAQAKKMRPVLYLLMKLMRLAASAVRVLVADMMNVNRH